MDLNEILKREYGKEMIISSNRLKRLPFNTTLAARNYGFDNILPSSDAHPGSKLCMAILRGDNLEVEQLLAQASLIFYQILNVVQWVKVKIH